MRRVGFLAFLLVWFVLLGLFIYFLQAPLRETTLAALIILGLIPPLLLLGLAVGKPTPRQQNTFGLASVAALAVSVGLLYLSSPTYLRNPQSPAEGLPAPYREERILGPYVPTPYPVVHKMLELAEVTEDDVVYDLGCGDGRIVITAAKKYGARGVGIEIDPKVAQQARELARQEQVEHLVEIREADALQVEDLERATVLGLYVFPEPLKEKLLPQFETRLKPGTRIVTHDYELGLKIPDKMTMLYTEDRLMGLKKHLVMLWRIEEKK